MPYVRVVVPYFAGLTRSSASSACMESTFKDPRGAAFSPVGRYGTFNLLSSFRQTLLHQFQRDDNIRTLFEAIRDAFAFAEEVDPFRDIRPGSIQRKNLRGHAAARFRVF
jgi:hypothetical protein